MNLTEREKRVLQLPEGITVSEWADRYRVLVPRSSKEPGPWRTERTPYLRTIMDTFCDTEVEEIVFCAAAQLGKTEAEINFIGYVIHQDPGPLLFVFPTQDIAEGFSRNRLQPSIDACSVLRDRKTSNAFDFQLLEMKFQSMTVFLGWSNSPAVLSSRPIRYLILDEIDKYPPFSGKEADPIALAKKRTSTYTKSFKKIIYTSTPTLETGNIWRQLQSCNVIYRYAVPCPYCGEYQFLYFQNIKWPKEEKDPETIRDIAWYECEKCHAHIKESEKQEMLLQGKWEIVEEKSTKRRKVGFHLSGLYSPFVTWGEIAAEFLEAKDDPALLMDFVNSRLAEPWKEVIEKRKEEEILCLRGNLDPGVVPPQAVALTAGVDTQEDGFYYVIHAWANDLDLTTWMIRYGFAHNWEELELILFYSAYRLDDKTIPIMRAFIDSGGHRTDEVYEWVRRNSRGIVYAIKGMSTKTSGVPFRESIIDKYPGKNKPIPGGLRLILINTDYYKDAINRKLQIESGRSGSWNLHKATGIDYATQMIAEEKRRIRKGLRYYEEWVQVGTQNHYLDASVYAFCAADHLQVRYLQPIITESPPQQIQQIIQQQRRPLKNSWLSRRPGWLR